MAIPTVPHFYNDAGVERIRIGANEFQCMGASPPHDHPHVYLDMGSDTEIICPYCSTIYERDPSLSAGESDPPGCLHQDTVAA